jgi:hypothetical protein
MAVRRIKEKVKYLETAYKYRGRGKSSTLDI